MDGNMTVLEGLLIFASISFIGFVVGLAFGLYALERAKGVMNDDN